MLFMVSSETFAFSASSNCERFRSFLLRFKFEESNFFNSIPCITNYANNLWRFELNASTLNFTKKGIVLHHRM